MKFIKYSIGLFCLSIGFYQAAKGQTLTADTAGGYKLVWADEFNTEGVPDVSNWQYEQGFVRNHELQWYQPENARCHKGMLVIEAQKVHQPNPNYVAQSTNWKTNRQFIEYTSSSMNTRNLHQWQYGRMVMRGRIDTDAGLWPAFWTLGVTQPWPSNGEIDIMEYYRGKLLANIACGTATPSKAKWYSTAKPLPEFNDPKWSKKFHVWRMDWDKTAISLYVDDLLLNRVELKNLVNQDSTGFNPFNQPHYILLNLTLGGDNGGDVSATHLPKRFEVDYVRVYQQQ
ncbi:glycoside hydrolase family 16 protein [Mucilaginibacter robiniae]|uniref:Glycoside hydrolase family 16 protein n=1 Tax=Mucilaginibacter robiniae TaxID=2728022 RepID=A0A7L5E3G2_9SPHI|nr:glycoside hydrolase family 16 protein [Mucilaginibacter robiniae]QJD96849.1 glycoside hydrolase family 16 protein [Mucilaginibacter robiniae]